MSLFKCPVCPDKGPYKSMKILYVHAKREHGWSAGELRRRLPAGTYGTNVVNQDVADKPEEVKKEENGLPEAGNKWSVTVSMVQSSKLNYCPCCGTNLEAVRKAVEGD